MPPSPLKSGQFRTPAGGATAYQLSMGLIRMGLASDRTLWSSLSPVPSSSATRLLQAAIVCLCVLAPAAVQAQTTDDLFNDQALGRVDLQIHSSDWTKLEENFQENTY